MLLRTYQERFISDIRAGFAKHKNVCAVGPTGFGKGVCLAWIADRAAKNHKRVWITAHRIEIVNQLSAHLTALGVPHGLVTSGRDHDDSHAIQVCSILTLRKRLGWIKPCDFLILDEAHHCVADTHRDVWAAYPHANVLGLTATPCRTSGQGLGRQAGGAFDTLVTGPTMKELIKLGYLSQPKHYSVPADEQPDLSKLHTMAGDYNKHELMAVMDKPRITGAAVEHYMRLIAPAPAICFVVNLAHAANVQAEYKARGINAAVIEGKMEADTRFDLLTSLGNGNLDVLISCGVVSEGVDVPNVGGVQDLCPSRSLTKTMQSWGRGSRIAPGKSTFVILDHVGNYTRHGLCDSERTWSLEGAKAAKVAQEKPIVVRTCPSCFACHEPAPVCPMCGHVYEVKERMPDYSEGELVEIKQHEPTPEEKYDAVFPPDDEAMLAKIVADLRKIQLERGYEPGWVGHVMGLRVLNKARDPIDPYAEIKVWTGEKPGEHFNMKQLIAFGVNKGYKNPYWWARLTLRARHGTKTIPTMDTLKQRRGVA